MLGYEDDVAEEALVEGMDAAEDGGVVAEGTEDVGAETKEVDSTVFASSTFNIFISIYRLAQVDDEDVAYKKNVAAQNDKEAAEENEVRICSTFLSIIGTDAFRCPQGNLHNNEENCFAAHNSENLVRTLVMVCLPILMSSYHRWLTSLTE